jgi:hypothetical protein
MIPSAYKDGKLYSIRPTDGSGDFTFSRGSNLAATRVDVNGLIEKGRENLLLQSNTFDTTWVNVSTTETANQSGYDNSNNAWKITASSTGSSRIIGQNNASTGVSTFSVYAKAGNINYLALENATDFAYISLIDGSLGNSGGANYITYSSTNVGSGWWRLSITFNKVSSSDLRIYLASSGSSTSVNSGDYIYIQDAQLEQGLVATDYIETGASTAQAGILEDLPRLDYSGGASCPALLLEPQRTNLIPHSEYFGASQWTSYYSTISSNDSTSPDGLENATRWTSTASGTFLTTSLFISDPSNLSVFVKYVDHPYIQLYSGASGGDYANFDIQNNTIGTSGYNTSNEKIESYGNGWYRISCTFSNVSAGSTARIGFAQSLTSNWGGLNTSAAGDVLIYGAQCESGSYPTSYIPTMGSAVTRSFDNAGTRTDMQDFLGVDTGAWFMHLDEFYFDITGTGLGAIILAENGQQATSIELVQDGQFQYKITINNSVAVQDLDGEDKLLINWSEDFFKIFVNGVNKYSSASGQYSHAFSHLFLPQTTRASHIKIKQMLFFPTALTDSECIALTTL